MSEVSTYTIFAGVNGAGKSTFYNSLKHDNDFGLRINTDEIVKELFNHDWKEPKAQFDAGKIAVKKIKECIETKKNFNQETTLTGASIVSNIKKAKENGFKINLYYVGLESAALSLERVEKRRKLGGHGIPQDDIMRRYDRSFENLEKILPLCDRIEIHDNSDTGAFNLTKPMLYVDNGEIISRGKSCPEYLSDILERYIAEKKQVDAL